MGPLGPGPGVLADRCAREAAAGAAVLAGSQDLGFPLGTGVPIGLLLLGGAILYALPRPAVLGTIYLTASRRRGRRAREHRLAALHPRPVRGVVAC